MPEYEIIIAGLPHVVLLSEAEAIAAGLTPVVKAAPAPANKERGQSPNKATDGRR